MAIRIFRLPLTEREIDVATRYVSGSTKGRIAIDLNVALTLVDHALYRAKMKYRSTGATVHTRDELRAQLVKQGHLTP